MQPITDAAGGIGVRRMDDADLPDVGRLGTLLIDAHHALDSTRFVTSTPNTARRYAEYLDAQRIRPNVIVLVAHADGEVIGYSYGAAEGDDPMALRGPAGVVYDLMVAPAHRRQRAGRLLLAAMGTELAALGTPRLVLSTAAANRPAQRLFAAMGFRPTMVEMTLDLPPADFRERLG